MTLDYGSTIWHVRVFHSGKVEDYYFRTKLDVMTSIYTTYSGVRDTIKIIDKGMHITVQSNDLLKQVHIEAQPMTVGMLIYDKPTHF